MGSDPACTFRDCQLRPCTACQTMENAQAQIAEAQRNLVHLKISRNASHDLLFGRLPLELVSRVFEIYVDIQNFDEKNAPFFSRRMEDAPLRLGKVCHSWRAIAWASPRLWTRMSIDVCFEGRKLIPELAMQWLERTGKLPLSICLYHNPHWNGMSKIETQKRISLIRAVCAFSSRCEILDIRIDDNAWSDEVLSQHWTPNGGTHDCNLRYLRLERLSPVFVKNLFSHFQSRPSPTCVKLHKVDINCLDINWRNVITFHTDSPAVRHCLQVLQVALCLRDLFFNSSGRAKVELIDDPLAPATYPTLQSMHLGLRRDYWKTVLNSLTVPSLETLCYTGRGSFEFIDSLHLLIARSHCEVKSLQLLNCRINDEFFSLLQVTNSLRNLILDHQLDTDAENLLDYLSKTTSNGLKRLPHLENLQISIDLDLPFSWKYVPNVFNPHQPDTASASDEPDSLQRRSLNLQLKLIGSLENVVGLNLQVDISSLQRIIKLLEQEIKISIRLQNDWESVESHDFIANSLAFHIRAMSLEVNSQSNDPIP